MFETAELGQKVSKEEFKEKVPLLREQLLEAQVRMREVGFPVIVLFSGVDGAGKGELANLLNEWMDPRFILTHAFDTCSQEEAERPDFWRYWRSLPPKGNLGIYLSAWYSEPLLARVYKKIEAGELDRRLDKIVHFERMLAVDGAVILKFWMHLGKQAQKRRFRKMEKDPLLAWRVTPKDWEHWKMYDRFIEAAEHILMKSSTGLAPWTIVEGEDANYRSLRVGGLILDGIQRRIAAAEKGVLWGGVGGPAPTEADGPPLPPIDASGGHPEPPEEPEVSPYLPETILSTLDMSKSLGKKEYRHELKRAQGELNLLQRELRAKGTSTILVFEGWDAAGKGGAIRRITRALDARDYKVIAIAAPTDEEKSHHYLWRFWRHLSPAGRVTIFDRSWYGRVLVERVQGFASEYEWRRAYSEINDFESQLVDHGIVLVKFWLHVTKDIQEERFHEREKIPFKRWKLTPEDWRNREHWAQYEVAVHDMIEKTSTHIAPWILVEGNDKRYARIKVLDSVCKAMRAAHG
jgi:polyphosphate kinase 2 (PPK2 family)